MLVPNRAHRHPYQEDVPEKYRDLDRWFLLDANLDKDRPWNLDTDIPVFSLALVRGEKPKRRWLLYGHSALEDRENVTIALPEFGNIEVDVPRAGAFYVIDERDGTVTPVVAAQNPTLRGR